jgi:hypothetical protein
MAKNRSPVTSAPRPAQAIAPRLQNLIASSASARKEGEPVPLVALGQEHQGQFGVDVSKAPVPQRRYAAEICSLSGDMHEVRIVFAQRCLMGDTLESAIVIRMSRKAAGEFLNSVDMPQIESMVATGSVELLDTITGRPRNTANMVANLVSVGVVDNETCMDFYHASAFAIAKIHNQSKLELEPVVRVDLRTSLFLPMMQKMAIVLAQ